MATFTITAAQNIDELASKAGGDIYNINGGTLTIDQDSRYGVNASTSASLGNVTISATLGGIFRIDARKVRLIPFDGGSGTVPAYNTLITGAAGSGKLIGVYSALNAAPVAPAAAMPATGFIKIKQWNDGAYVDNEALGGITATVNGTDTVGWIQVVGDDAATLNVPRLGKWEVRGDWYSIGTASGSSATTWQLPTMGLSLWCPGVWVETASGSGVYEFYPNNLGNIAASSTATDAVRGKVCWINSSGVLRLGSDGTNTVGYVPASGCKIRMPNVHVVNCTTAARTANVIPNTTFGTRFDLTTTSGGVLDVEFLSGSWYTNLSQAYSVSFKNSAFMTQIYIGECVSPIVIENVGVGCSDATSNYPLDIRQCLGGGTITDFVGLRATLAASGQYGILLQDSVDLTFIRPKIIAGAVRGNATTGIATITRCVNTTFTDPVFIGGRVLLATCVNTKFTNTVYVDRITGTTGTTNPMSVWEVTLGCIDTMCDGLTFGGLTNVHPYTAVLTVGLALCQGTTLRNIGSRAAPLSLGSASASGYLLNCIAAAVALNVRVQRCWVSNTRTNLWLVDNSCKGFTFENVGGDVADAPICAAANLKIKGVKANVDPAAQAGVYGTHFALEYTSDTAGSLGVLMNETTVETATQVAVISGTPSFTGAGGLVMAALNDEIEFTMPDFMLGITQFTNSATTMAGGTIGNYSLTYQIDLNDGNGWNGTWLAMTGANLSGHTLNAALGVKLKIRIKTTTASATAITSISIPITTTTTAQEYAYPLDTNTVTFTGLPTGCDIVVLTAGTSTILEQKDAWASSSYGFTFSGAQTIDIGFLKPGYVPYYIRNLALTAVDSSIPVTLIPDRNYA